jgi:hypothetical protein
MILDLAKAVPIETEIARRGSASRASSPQGRKRICSVPMLSLRRRGLALELGHTLEERDHGGDQLAVFSRMLGFKPAWALGSAGALRNFPVLDGIESLTLINPTSAVAALEAKRRQNAGTVGRMPAARYGLTALTSRARTSLTLLRGARHE